jgi:hypothetical protein
MLQEAIKKASMRDGVVTKERDKMAKLRKAD